MENSISNCLKRLIGLYFLLSRKKEIKNTVCRNIRNPVLEMNTLYFNLRICPLVNNEKHIGSIFNFSLFKESSLRGWTCSLLNFLSAELNIFKMMDKKQALFRTFQGQTLRADENLGFENSFLLCLFSLCCMKATCIWMHQIRLEGKLYSSVPAQETISDL